MGRKWDAIGLGPGAEFDLIRRFLEGHQVARPDVRVGPGDDCAVVVGDGIAVSADLSVEGVHFRRDWLRPEEIGQRAAAAAISDLAAVAARPIGVLASLALPDADVPDVAVEIMAGVRRVAEEAGAALLGGDVVRSPDSLVLDIVVLGEAPRPVLRSGARPGDALWVTGRLGGAAAAVESWRQGRTPVPAAREAFARPRPRVIEARWLAERGVLHALIDLSDGLGGDVAHLAAASGVRIVLDLARIPLHPAALEVAASPEDALRLALAGGEDYELCFAAPRGAVDALAPEFEARFGVPLSRVGEIEEGDGVYQRRDDGSIESLAVTGYRHFEGGSR
jgi:thiamine-monophosphate kinase